jgi:hypothetical protein
MQKISQKCEELGGISLKMYQILQQRGGKEPTQVLKIRQIPQGEVK